MTAPRSVPPHAGAVSDQVPRCETGPLGPLGWTIREIAGLLLRRDPHDSDNETDDAR